MAVLSDYTSGTISLANGSATVTGTGTLFEVTRFREGDTLQIQNLTAVIASVDSDTQLTLTEPWTGTSIVDGPYRARQLADGTRVGTQAATLIELLGDGTLAGLAALGVEEGKAPVGGPAGQYVLEPVATDPNGSVASLAALTLAVRQILQTDAAGDLKQVALAANKALATDANGDVTPIDLGTLGRALLALAAGNNTQYVQGDGTLQSKTELPISSATQTALNSKASLSGAGFTGRITLSSPTGGQTTPEVRFNIGGQFQSSVYGENATANGHGPSVVFYATAGSLGGTSWGIFNHYGNLTIPGALNAASKSFIIDHPLDPYNKDLVFASTESPHHGVEFWGTVRLENGSAIVDIDAASGLSPGTFEALTQRAVALQPNNLDSDTHVRCGHVVNGKFTIYASDPNCNDEVSWLVKAERNDVLVGTLPHTDPASGRLIPEQEKPEA